MPNQETQQSNIEVVFRPIPNSSQELALDSHADHTLYHGARGPGKTITQLMKFRRYVGQGYGYYWRGVIFDREYKNLSDLIAQSKRFFLKFDDGAQFLSSQSDLKWVWPNGEELLFRHVKKPDDYDAFHGHEYPFIGWNELTKHATPVLYDKMMSCNRSSYQPEKDGWVGGTSRPNGPPVGMNGEIPPPIPLIVFSTTNPSGSGHNWVKKRFIDAAPIPGSVVKKETKLFNPITGEDMTVVKTQVAIFGSAFENIYLPAEYIAEIASISNPNLRAAWLHGNWDVVAGGAFDDLWNKNVHVVPKFNIPSSWKLDRSFDWGSSHPFSVGFWAEANGEEAILPNGSKFCPAPGSLIQIGEIYGSAKGETNVGLKWSSTKVAEAIRDAEIKMIANKFILSQPFPGPADNQIRNVIDKETETIEYKMAKVGIRWTESDKAPGSRKIGMQLLRDRLEAAVLNNGLPAIYFMEHCTASISTLPTLPRDDDDLDDVDTDAEDHAYDMIRYRVLKSSYRYAKKINVKFST